VRHVIPPIAAAAVLLGAARADAHEPPRWHAGASFGFAQLWGGPTSAGFGGGMHLTYAINDMFNLLSAINATAHPYSQWVIVSGGLGAAYVVDVGQWTPHIGALAGPAGLLSTDPLCGASISEPCRGFRLSLEIPFGIDYQITRRFAVGLAGRFQLLLLGEQPWMTLGIYAKAEYTWGTTGPR
jgi:hypothetical protein